MKRLAFLILVLCGLQGILMAQETKTFSRFEGKPITGIDASGCWQMNIRQGNSTQVTVTFPARYEKEVVLELSADGILKLAMNGRIQLGAGEKFIAEVTCSALNCVDLSGATQLRGEGQFTGLNMKFDLSGAAKMIVNGDLIAKEQAEFDLSGAAQLSARGKAVQVNIELSGAAVLNLQGDAANADLEASGASKVEMGGFTLRKAKVDASGASKVSLNVAELIEGEVSGASKLIYKGGASTRVDVSGASKLRHE